MGQQMDAKDGDPVACKACMKPMTASDVKCASCGAAVKMDDDGGGDGGGTEMTAQPPAKEPDGDEGGGKGDNDGDETDMKQCRGESVELAAKSGDTKQVWIQVAKQGAFKGHAAGAFEMTLATFQEIIRNFTAQKNRAIPVDFEHASEQAPTEGSIPVLGAPAQGWITELAIREGNLWGLVQWGDLARKYIKAGQYRFLSPAIVFGSKDRVTGKTIGARLSSVALTNNPFLDGMQPIAAKRIEAKDVDHDVVATICKTLQLPEALCDVGSASYTLRVMSNSATLRGSTATKLREALRLPLTMSVDEVFAVAREACGEIRMTATSPAVPAAKEENQPATANHQEAHMGDTVKNNQELETKVSDLTLKLSASEAEKKTLRDDYEGRLTTLSQENADLKAKVASFEEKEISGLVDSAIQVWGEKRGLTAESRPHLMRLAKNDREGFLALYPQPTGARPETKMLSTTHAVPGNQIPASGSGEVGAKVINLKAVISDEGIPDIETMAQKLMSDAKAAGAEMSREEAYGKAFTMRTDLINKAANKRLAGIGG